MPLNLIDLKAEQQNSLNRPSYKYTLPARFFFFTFDLVTGKKLTLAKAKFLEILASIPYREWEIRQYFKLTQKFRNGEKVKKAQEIAEWGREAQDNEYTHLRVIHEKMKEDGIKDPWFLSPLIAFGVVMFYVCISKMLAWINIKGAYHFNAQFEDHAEHVYANMVKENPQWESQLVNNPFVREYANVGTWADVFRRIGLDERDHMNHSFYYGGKSKFIFKYNGMPEMGQ